MGVLPDTNQLGLGERRWNPTTSSEEVEFRLRTVQHCAICIQEQNVWYWIKWEHY